MNNAKLAAVILGASLMLAADSAFGGGIDPAEFASDSQRDNYRAAIKRLRCMVCQNQTLGESDAPLAKDMRAKARKLARESKSEDDIVNFMTARYGDFVVYRPPVDSRTLPLWIAPFALALLALCCLPLVLRRRAIAASPDETATSEKLLNEQ